MTEKLRSVLVTDRTQSDVNDRNEKGTYNEADLNRVLRACSWLAGKLEGYGYSAAGGFFPAALVHVTVRPPGSGRAESVLAYLGETAVVRAAGVSSFNGRTGAVAPGDNDYTAAMVGARADDWMPTAADVGAATMTQVNAAIQAAVLDSWEGSY